MVRSLRAGKIFESGKSGSHKGEESLIVTPRGYHIQDISTSPPDGVLVSFTDIFQLPVSFVLPSIIGARRGEKEISLSYASSGCGCVRATYSNWKTHLFLPFPRCLDQMAHIIGSYSLRNFQAFVFFTDNSWKLGILLFVLGISTVCSSETFFGSDAILEEG